MGEKPERRSQASFMRPLTLALIALALAVLGVTTHIARKLPYTGDEPRYMLYALSLRLEHKPVMSEEGYEAFRQQPRPPNKVAASPMRDIQFGAKEPQHSITASLMFAPLAASFPLQQIRLIALLAGLAGLIFLARLILAQSTSILEAVACFVPAAFFFPAVSYYFLALPEIFLFLLVSIAFWNLLSVAGTRVRDYWPCILASSLAPFFQLRGAALFVTVAACLAWRFVWRRDFKSSWRALSGLTLSYVCAGVLLLLYNQWVNGSPLGSANSARPAIGIDTVTNLFLNSRHGLLIYAPIYLLSFSGIVAGIWQRRPWAWPAAIFLTLSVLASAGPDPGESFPARFWVQAVPVLSLALLGYTNGKIYSVPKIAIYLPLAIVCGTNTVLFFAKPGLYLSARSGPLPYDELFSFVSGIHLGFWTNVLTAPAYRTGALLYLLTFVALLAAASIYRSKVISGAALAALLVTFELHRAKPVDSNVQLQPDNIAIAIDDPAVSRRAPLRVQLWPSWTPDPTEYLTEVSEGETHWQQITRGLLILRKDSKWQTPLVLNISWDSSRPAKPEAGSIRVAVSTSWLAGLW